MSIHQITYPPDKVRPNVIREFTLTPDEGAELPYASPLDFQHTIESNLWCGYSFEAGKTFAVKQYYIVAKNALDVVKSSPQLFQINQVPPRRSRSQHESLLNILHHFECNDAQEVVAWAPYLRFMPGGEGMVIIKHEMKLYGHILDGVTLGIGVESSQ